MNFKFGPGKDTREDKYYKKQPLQSGVRSCDIVLTRRRELNPFNNFVRDAICDLTNGIVSHALVIARGPDIIEAQPGGITVTTLDSYLNEWDGLLVLRNESLTEDQKSNMLSYFYSQRGIKYNWPGFISFVAPWLTKPSKKDLYCSQFVATGYMKEGIEVSGNPAYETSPQDLLDFQYTEGCLSETPEGKLEWKLADSQNFDIESVKKFMRDKYSV